MAWALGRFNCDHMIETGCGEGETIGYFSRFLPSMGGGVDLNQDVIEIAHSRYPRVGFAVMDAIEFLQKADPRPGKAVAPPKINCQLSSSDGMHQ